MSYEAKSQMYACTLKLGFSAQKRLENPLLSQQKKGNFGKSWVEIVKHVLIFERVLHHLVDNSSQTVHNLSIG